MPLIECYLNEMTDELALKLEREITASIREAVAKELQARKKTVA